ncbi:MAG: altronate dehydratase family protein [Paracoccaceae bacterium]|nr:altronate dehydratase family protein [Paracoccaceae bacterium]
MRDRHLTTIQLNENDHVAIALTGLRQGESIDASGLTVSDAVPAGHKLAIVPIGEGQKVLKYGQVIGTALTDIAPGEHVHSHNLGMGGHGQDYAIGQECRPLPVVNDRETRKFMGYHRGNGTVGTRNYLGIVTSVNCSGSVARFIAGAVEASGWLEEFGNVDGVVPIVHGTGCGMSDRNLGYATLFRTLSGYARNPNFGGILFLGLGCEVMQIPDLLGPRRLRNDGSFRYMIIQQTGGTRRTVDRGVSIVRELAEIANREERKPAPAGRLTVGLQCGGSDGYSGITANPALGVTSDLLVRHGGTAILSETPEIYGAEHLLTRRAVNADVGRKLIDRIHWWQDYAARNDCEMDNNPTPGNKRGGLTTILEKSLGAIAKGGTAPLAAVCEYGERPKTAGLVFMDSPGYDPCSVTGQIAAGANLIAFTTGRGSVSGYMPTPCVKLASNDDLYRRMGDDMDMNCGDIVSDGISPDRKGGEIFDLFLRVASGERTRSELLGFGGAEFVPWQIGAVM